MKRLTISLFIVLGTILSATASEIQTWTPKWEKVKVEEKGVKTIDTFERVDFTITFNMGTNGAWLEITGGHLEGKHNLENFEEMNLGGVQITFCDFQFEGETITLQIKSGMDKSFGLHNDWSEWSQTPKPDKITKVTFVM